MFTSRHAQLKLTTFDVRPRGAAGGYFALFYGSRLAEHRATGSQDARARPEAARGAQPQASTERVRTRATPSPWRSARRALRIDQGWIRKAAQRASTSGARRPISRTSHDTRETSMGERCNAAQRRQQKAFGPAPDECSGAC